MLENRSGYIENRAYILPNEEIASTQPLDQFKTTVRKVEQLAGIILTNT